MDGSLSNKPKNFVDDPEKIYRQRRREARSRKPELVDPKVEADDSSSSPQATPPTSPKEAPLHQGMALPEPERTIGELCTPDIRDLPIQNLDNIGVPFEIKTSIIRMVQSSPFTGKEDANLHLQAFLQLCRTFDMQGMTQDQMRARLFPFSTWESVAMVSFSTAAHSAKLGVLDEGVHDGVLLTGQDPNFAQQDCYIRASPDGDFCGSL